MLASLAGVDLIGVFISCPYHFYIIKSINIRQILTVFLAGCLLVISTACSQGNMAQAGGKAYTETAKRAMSDTYDDYDANQDFQGGMNGYNDDRRYNAETAAKAKAFGLYAIA